MSHAPQVGVPFPDRQLAITYEEGVAYIRYRLHMFAHGTLKPWAASQEMNYAMLINLKNNRIARQTPLLIQRLLALFGFETDPLRTGPTRQWSYLFQFRQLKDLATFRTQLAALQPETLSSVA